MYSAVNAIIADDNQDLCIELANELNVTKDVKVIEMITEGNKVIQEVKRLGPELILLDMKLPGMNGLQIIDELEKDTSISAKVVVYSGETNYIAKVRNSRCVVKYITKNSCFKDVCLQIQDIARAISEKTLNQKILDYLLDIGFSTTNRGTRFLKECICIFLKQEQEDCKMKDLFEKVAMINSTKICKVKNNIQTSTKLAWLLGNREYITDKLKLRANGRNVNKKSCNNG